MKTILKRILITLASVLLLALGVFFGGVLWSVTLLPPGVSRKDVAIANVTIIDTENGESLPDMTVVVSSRRIVSMGRAGSVVIPEGARVLDGTGKFLIPRLWDMHVHVNSKLSPILHMPLFIAHGVTGVRDMSDCRNPSDPFLACVEDKRKWHQQVMEGDLVGPQILGVGSFVIHRPSEEEQQLVHYLEEERGVDFIKVGNWIPRNSFFALMEEARKVGIPVVGHRPRPVSAVAASNAGQLSFEHARLFLFECFPGADAYRDGKTDFRVSTELRRQMIDEHDPSMCEEIFSVLARNQTWFTPTHGTRKMDAFADNEVYRDDPRLKYISWLQQRAWNKNADGTVARDPSPEGRKAFIDFFLKGLELTGRAHAAGVKILAGTDANDAYIFPGSSLHDELEMLVQAGLSPGEALKSATVNPAIYFSKTEDYGTIGTGKVADLILLEANPLGDIANIRRINAVVFNGNVYDRDALNRLLDHVEEEAGSFSLSCKLIWGYLRSELFF